MVLIPFFPLPSFLFPLLDFEAVPVFLTGFLLPLLDFEGDFFPLLDFEGDFLPLLDFEGLFLPLLDFEGLFLPLLDFEGLFLPLLDFVAFPAFLTGFLLPALDFVALPTFLTGFLLPLLDFVFLTPLLLLDFAAFLGPLLGPIFLTSPGSALLTRRELISSERLSSTSPAHWQAAIVRSVKNTRHSLFIFVLRCCDAETERRSEHSGLTLSFYSPPDLSSVEHLENDN